MGNIGLMSRDGIQEAREINPLDVQRSNQVEQSIEGCEQLLPGIPDEISINLIAPKLPWTTFHMLSSVSRPWQRAIQSHEIYDARVRSRSTQPLISFCGWPQGRRKSTIIGIFSLDDGSYLYLPPMPGSGPEAVLLCTRVFLDGKLYVLGGRGYEASTEVYMLDLAGQRQWKQCASMAVARTWLGCGVKDGKIYTFGGWGDNRDPVYKSEVYDPKKDAWSPIMSRSMHYGGICEKVTTVGDELFVHSGVRYTSRFPLGSYASDAQVYHSQNDQWRIVGNLKGNSGDNGLLEGIVLTVKGKLHKLTRFGIQVFDMRASSWNPLLPFSFGESKPNHSFEIYPLAALIVDDEVLALVEWRNTGEAQIRTFFLRSQGVGGENREVLWQTLPCSLPLENDPLSCLIQL